MPLTPEVKQAMFDSLKKVMEKYAPPMVVCKSTAGVGYELMGNKPVPYGYDKKIVPGMYFSSIVGRKDSVSFYFFPIYYHTADFIDLIPTMAKCLKGKTCFTFKKPEQINTKELDALLKKGVGAWKKLGYMK